MDQYDNFIFYGSWKEHLNGLKELCDRETAKEVAWQIINYGTEKEFDTDDQKIINMVNGMCRDLIESAKKRRLASIGNGKQGGRPSKHSNEEVWELHEQGLSDSEIADKFGCSVKTVKRKLASFQEDEI